MNKVFWFDDEPSTVRRFVDSLRHDHSNSVKLETQKDFVKAVETVSGSKFDLYLLDMHVKRHVLIPDKLRMFQNTYDVPPEAKLFGLSLGEFILDKHADAHIVFVSHYYGASVQFVERHPQNAKFFGKTEPISRIMDILNWSKGIW